MCKGDEERAGQGIESLDESQASESMVPVLLYIFSWKEK